VKHFVFTVWLVVKICHRNTTRLNATSEIVTLLSERNMLFVSRKLNIRLVFVKRRMKQRAEIMQCQQVHSPFAKHECKTKQMQYPDFSGYECGIGDVCDNQDGARVTEYWRRKVWRPDSVVVVAYVAVDSSKLIDVAVTLISVSAFRHLCTVM